VTTPEAKTMQDEALTTEQLDEEIEINPTTDLEGDDDSAEDVIDIEDNDLGEDVDEDDEPEFNHTAELKELIEAGNQEAALTRLQQMEKGMEKLLARDSQSKYAIEQAQALDTAFREAASGDLEAQRQVKDLLVQYGIDIDELAIADEYAESTKKPDSKVAELEAKIARLEAERSNERWLEKNERLLERARSITKIDYTQADLVAARPYLPKSGQITSKQLVEAIHQGNPALLSKLIAPRTQRQLGNSAKLGTSSGATQSVKGQDIMQMNSEQWANWARQHLKGNR